MAKASEMDQINAVDFLPVAESILQDRRFPADHEQEGAPIDGKEAEALDLLADAYESASMSRVVWGYCVLIDKKNEVVDQNSKVLELHPRIKEALETTILYPASEWAEDYGDCLWWIIPEGASHPNEPPRHIGSPIDCQWDKTAGYSHFSKLPKRLKVKKGGE